MDVFMDTWIFGVNKRRKRHFFISVTMHKMHTYHSHENLYTAFIISSCSEHIEGDKTFKLMKCTLTFSYCLSHLIYMLMVQTWAFSPLFVAYRRFKAKKKNILESSPPPEMLTEIPGKLLIMSILPFAHFVFSQLLVWCEGERCVLKAHLKRAQLDLHLTQIMIIHLKVVEVTHNLNKWR